MSDDIVARLIDVEGGYGFRAICREAAEEIQRLRAGGCARDQKTTQFCAEAVALQREVERLRLEMSIPRDEYAMTWKNLLDRIDGLDIVEWIRAYANAHSPSDYSSPIAREVIDRSDKKWMEAADEIERLRKEVQQ